MTIKFKRFLLRAPLVGLLLLVTSVAALTQDQPLRIKYWLAMSHPNSHLFEVNIEVEVPSETKLESIDFQMPKWSPGRYAVFDFAKNVQEFGANHLDCQRRGQTGSAIDCHSVPLAFNRIDDQTWRVLIGSNSTFFVAYKVFANDLSGTFSQLN